MTGKQTGCEIMNGPFPYDMLTDEQYKTYLKRIHPQSGSNIDEKYEACITLGKSQPIITRK